MGQSENSSYCELGFDTERLISLIADCRDWSFETMFQLDPGEKMAAMYYLEITVLYFKLCRCKSSVLQSQIKFMKMRHLLYLFKLFFQLR
jgi:hypothetical protein